MNKIFKSVEMRGVFILFSLEKYFLLFLIFFLIINVGIKRLKRRRCKIFFWNYQNVQNANILTLELLTIFILHEKHRAKFSLPVAFDRPTFSLSPLLAFQRPRFSDTDSTPAMYIYISRLNAQNSPCSKSSPSTH